jgi:hypothetical protein
MKAATWRDLVIGGFVALMLGASAAWLLTGPRERQLVVEVDGASLAAADGGEVEIAVAPATLRLQCRGGCDDLNLRFKGSPDHAASMRITDRSGRAVEADVESGPAAMERGGLAQAEARQ